MLEIDGSRLTLADVLKVARFGESVRLSDAGFQAIQTSRQNLEAIMATDRPVYGINTGFGIFSDRRIAWEDSAALSRNLILSHAVGTGPALARRNCTRGHAGAGQYAGQRLLWRAGGDCPNSAGHAQRRHNAGGALAGLAGFVR